jgi:hypothetical protein
MIFEELCEESREGRVVEGSEEKLVVNGWMGQGEMGSRKWQLVEGEEVIGIVGKVLGE